MKNRKDIKTETYTNFPFYDEDGNKIDELFFNCYSINEQFPEKGIVVFSELRSSKHSYYSIGYTNNIEELVIRKKHYIISKKINSILVGECEYNEETESYIIKIRETKNINNRFRGSYSIKTK